MINYSDVKRNGFVDLWDTGPQRPLPPDPPKQPKLDSKVDADNILAKLEHEDRIRDYEGELRRYGVLKREYDEWRLNVGGPRKIEMWPVGAKEVLQAQADGKYPERYHKRLPAGMKPGKLQLEADARERAAADARQHDIDTDPHFGIDAIQTRRPQPTFRETN
jgi:hypothetical protein